MFMFYSIHRSRHLMNVISMRYVMTSEHLLNVSKLHVSKYSCSQIPQLQSDPPVHMGVDRICLASKIDLNDIPCNSIYYMSRLVGI